MAAVVARDWIRDEGLPEESREMLAELRELVNEYFSGPSEGKNALSQRITGRFFVLYAEAAKRLAASADSGDPLDRRLVRLAAPVPGSLGDKLSAAIAGTVDAHRGESGIHYADEWYSAIARAELAPSTADEAASALGTRSTSAGAKLQRMERELLMLGPQVDQAAAESLALDQKISEYAAQLLALGQEYRELLSGESVANGDIEKAVSLHRQRIALLRDLGQATDGTAPADRAVAEAQRQHMAAAAEAEKLRAQVDAEGDARVADVSRISGELETVRQMMKMAIGRRGSHFPVASSSFLRGPASSFLNTRERVAEQMAQCETIDPGLFMRTSHGQQVRVEPLVLILPCFGNNGLCWEPWQAGNRRTPGRIAIPFYCARPQNDLTLRALAALRWEIARETAMHYWMEEGLTGAYYQLKERDRSARLEDLFADDYVLWITKEAEGHPVLDTKTRAVFWRHCPFSDGTRARLTQHATYRPLLEADHRRAESRFAATA